MIGLSVHTCTYTCICAVQFEIWEISKFQKSAKIKNRVAKSNLVPKKITI